MASPIITTPKRNISLIWLLPFVAVLVAGWMFYQQYLQQGHTIFIKMEDAEGLVIGKTEIKVRNVRVGYIESLRLVVEQNSVIARAKIDNEYVELLTDDSKLWVVKPRIDETGISGMGTLLSGVYIELQPGKSKTTANLFTLQEHPALISQDIEGKRFALQSQGGEVLDVGTGIFFRNYKIGQIETSEFEMETQQMRYGLFIYAPFDQLIADNSLFWLSSGLSVEMSVNGISINTGSLSKLLKGGISIDYPPGKNKGTLVDDGAEFPLYATYSEAIEQRFNDFDYYLIEFEQSIRGLTEGAPVEYRGMRIGTVAQAPAKMLVNDKPLHFRTDDTSIPVVIRLEYGRIFENSKEARAFWQENIEKWINSGLRASLKSGNFLTGGVYVDFDIYANAPTTRMRQNAYYPVLPSIASGFTALSEQVSALLNKLNALPLEGTVTQLNAALGEYQELAKGLNATISELNNNGVANKMAHNLDSLKLTLDQLTSSLKQFEGTLSHYQKGSSMVEQLTNTLSELEQLSKTLLPITKGLQEQPNMLLFNKQFPDDPQPGKQQ
ncbi:intermembrane transport protein PqiB [Pseudoalteromonas fenneropenaei]|uniref:Intermembrane transport protein PqiB n=1 Tax=Pseudoalteromonas fenneropenaei TaxID=1737459 RepID=A0ABV7CMP3_9GAMM